MAKRVIWATDIHLNFLDAEQRKLLVKSIVDQSPDALLLTGDIAESPSVVACLEALAKDVGRPIYFVLGNHDYYRGSIAGTRGEVNRLAERTEALVYLSSVEMVELTPAIAIVGHDGWGDTRLGCYETSDLVLNDFLLIEELATARRGLDGIDRHVLRPILQHLGDQAAEHFGRALARAFESHTEVIALTHVPPFREACWHNRGYSDDNWLPFFAAKAVGDVMLRVMDERPECELTVLCGHTHSGGQTRLRENLLVLTGGAEYGKPMIQRAFDFE